MKTTIEIDDALARALKRRAVDKSESLSSVINQLLRNALAFEVNPAGSVPFRMITFGGEPNSVVGRPEVFKEIEAETEAGPFRRPQQ